MENLTSDNEPRAKQMAGLLLLFSFLKGYSSDLALHRSVHLERLIEVSESGLRFVCFLLLYFLKSQSGIS